ncbi:MAG TPA: cytochrome c oxidase accessory protein CcoG [Acidobacteriota bacterium]|nr:cytochrome c oxidase accessory protein CcoG [Acidobacteriota bacterium]
MGAATRLRSNHDMSAEQKPNITPTPAPSARPTPPKSAAAVARHLPSRETVTTINQDGSRYFLYPADVHGWFTRWRRHTGLFLIAIYLLLPWIPVGGYPAVFLDIAERRFHFFGYTLAAQDAWLLFFGLTGMGFGLFFLTSLFGRLWCGYACPQTVFLDHIYRRIERMIDGDAHTRRQLAAAPMTGGKLVRRVLKHTLYILTSLVITHLFLAYFVSWPEVWHWMSSAPREHWAAFVFMAIATGILYFNFAWFREQLCIVICPYGRMQSALTDDNTVTIGYDAKRGEPRGKVGTPDAGACIDCNRCVQVCPTGIDIRHAGLQLECIGCAACIDACDEVMTKLKRPKGLIRYDSLVGLAGGKTHWVRPRTIVYAVLLLIGIGVATFSFSTVKPASMIVFRMTGAAFFVDRDDVRNQFLLRIVNKRSEPTTFTVTLDGVPAGVKQSGFNAPVTVAPQAELVSPLVLASTRKQYSGPFKFTVRVEDQQKSLSLARTIEFLGPDARLLEEEDRSKGITR